MLPVAPLTERNMQMWYILLSTVFKRHSSESKIMWLHTKQWVHTVIVYITQNDCGQLSNISETGGLGEMNGIEIVLTF